MKKVTLLFLTMLIALTLFGCVKSEKNEEDVSTSENVSLTEKEDTETTEQVSSEIIDVSSENNEVTTSSPTNEATNYKTTVGSSENEKEPVTDKEVATDDKTETTEPTKKENIFSVTFKDYNGDVLKEEKVKKGEDATAPEPPKRDGFIFVKWDTYYKEVKTNIVVTAIYEELSDPTLIVDSVKATDKDVVVKVSAVNNPGLLALVLKITYDEDVMSLKNVESGASMNDYTFTAPKNKKSGCNAAWNIIDVPENAADGEIAVLHFEIAEDAKVGTYDVKVTCYDGAFDSKYEPVKFSIINGSVNII